MVENAPMKFTKKPIAVEAMQFTGKNSAAVKEWVNSSPKVESFETWFLTKSMSNPTGNQAWNYVKDEKWGSDIVAAVYDYLHDTWVGVKKGQWIIRGVSGEYYPCDEDVLAETYDRA